jgi:hypothetical protein
MNRRMKTALWLVGIVVMAAIALTLGSTLWKLYAVRSGIRFSVQLHQGKNEIDLALWRGTYVYQVASEPTVGLGTIVHENTNLVVRTSVTRGEALLISESAKQFQSFTINDVSGSLVKLVIHLDSALADSVYLSFRRGL